MKSQPVFIVWKDEYSVNHKELDENHKIAMTIINDLYDAHKNAKGQDTVNKILNNLLEYTKMHFSYEEQVMSDCNFPNVSEHASIHNKMFIKTNQLIFLVTSTTGNITTLEILTFLKEWWIDHVLKMDKEYSPYMPTE